MNSEISMSLREQQALADALDDEHESHATYQKWRKRQLQFGQAKAPMRAGARWFMIRDFAQIPNDVVTAPRAYDQFGGHAKP